MEQLRQAGAAEAEVRFVQVREWLELLSWLRRHLALPVLLESQLALPVLLESQLQRTLRLWQVVHWAW